MVIFSQCLDCKNYCGKENNEKYICKSYPNGIPEEIFWNKISHEENIEGDNGYKYEYIGNITTSF